MMIKNGISIAYIFITWLNISWIHSLLTILKYT